MMNDLHLKLHELYEEAKGWFVYDVLKANYKPDMPYSIRFEYTPDEKNKTMLISSPDHLGLCTVSKINANEDEVVELVNDAILTYFDVPRYKALQIKNKFKPQNPPRRTKSNIREFVFA